MQTKLKTQLFAVLPLTAVLFTTPAAFADRQHHPHRYHWQHHSSSPYYNQGSNQGWYGPQHHTDWRSRKDDSNRQRGRYSESTRHPRKYMKAMKRLNRQEQKATAKAYRRHGGNRHDPRYQNRVGKIQQKYNHKRQKVVRNLK